MVLGGDSVVGELGAAATKLDPSCNIGLFSALRPAMDLSTAAYRYNQNMMEYYTCEYSIQVSAWRYDDFVAIEGIVILYRSCNVSLYTVGSNNIIWLSNNTRVRK